MLVRGAEKAAGTLPIRALGSARHSVRSLKIPDGRDIRRRPRVPLLLG